METIRQVKREGLVLKDNEVLLKLVELLQELRYQEFEQATDKNFFAKAGVLIWNDIKRLVSQRLGVSWKEFKIKDRIGLELELDGVNETEGSRHCKQTVLGKTMVKNKEEILDRMKDW